ncbi:MAG TPA: hypothetical protein VGO02_07680, partial [Burkholderiales bacterium]|nr:hypothetical protein [Burkholderiales bacterium]
MKTPAALVCLVLACLLPVGCSVLQASAADTVVGEALVAARAPAAEQKAALARAQAAFTSDM